MRPLLRGITGLVGFLALGEVVCRSGLVQQEYLPPPSIVLTRLVIQLGDPMFLLDIVATVLAWGIALGIATAIAVPAGLLLGSVRGIRAATRVVIDFLRPIPSVALIPLAIVLIGSGPETKISLAVYGSVWPILFNTIYALDETDPVMLDTARSFGLKRGQVMFRVALPNAAPFVLTGVRVAASMALIMVISTELLAGGSGGIGGVILGASSGSGRMDLVLAGTVAAGLLGYLVNEALERAQRRWMRWHTAREAT